MAKPELCPLCRAQVGAQTQLVCAATPIGGAEHNQVPGRNQTPPRRAQRHTLSEETGTRS